MPLGTLSGPCGRPLLPDASTSAGFRQDNGEGVQSCPGSRRSLPVAVASGPAGRARGRRRGARFPAADERQESRGKAFFLSWAETGSSRFWKLYLTPLPPGGSRAEQALPALSEPSRFLRRLHRRGPRYRCLADTHKLEREHSFCDSEESCRTDSGRQRLRSRSWH